MRVTSEDGPEPRLFGRAFEVDEPEKNWRQFWWKEKLLPLRYESKRSNNKMKNYQSEKNCDKHKCRSKINYESFGGKSIIFKIRIYAAFFFLILSFFHKQIRKPQICEQNIYIDKIQQYLLNQLYNTRNWHWNHRVYCHKRKVIQAVPDILNKDWKANIYR